MNLFYQLDEKINSVAVKVMHLGGQLEAVNIPRSRAAEAQKLMTYFSQFLIPGNVVIEIFSNSERVIILKYFERTWGVQDAQSPRFAEAP